MEIFNKIMKDYYEGGDPDTTPLWMAAGMLAEQEKRTLLVRNVVRDTSIYVFGVLPALLVIWALIWTIFS
jgi:hypothetical protein